MPCFGRRWWHRRQREMDVLFLLPAICQAADAYAGGSEIERNARIDAAMNLHKLQPGEKHWRCACAIADGVAPWT